jgi:hypothetical protein
MSKTGYAPGSLSPVIYFEREDGYIVLPQYDAGNIEMARHYFEARYRNHPTEKWMWRECGMQLRDVDALQKRLVDQEHRQNQQMLEVHYEMREAVRKQVRDSLYQKMVSSSTSPFEREAIGYYLDMRDDAKRDKWRTQIEATQCYLWARENDANTKVEDRQVIQPGEFWRTAEAQRG